jgi:putative DNA methylase
MIPKECKRLAEVDFPIAVVSKHSAREKSIRHGHPSTLHLWWARRPLGACRAMLLALLLPDPCDEHCPGDFKAKARQLLLKTEPSVGRTDKDLRRALLDFIGDFANWDNSSDPKYLEVGRGLVKAAHPEETPLVVDPFAGGGSIPLEALRLGCDAFASDLNPVACLILKVMLEDIPRHGPELADEVRRVGAEIKKEAEEELTEFYPADPDGATPIAYLWARTVRCEAPKCGAEIPLMRSFWLCKKPGRKRALKYKVIRPADKPPHVEFEVFEPKTENEVSSGTVTRAKASCLCCGNVLSPDRVKAQLSAQRGGADVVFDKNGNRTGGARLLAVVTLRSGETGRHYRLLNKHDYHAVWKAQTRLKTIRDEWECSDKRRLSPVPDEPTPAGGGSGAGRAFSVQKYGMMTFGDLFTARQNVAMVTITRMTSAALSDANRSEIAEPLALAVTRTADYSSTICTWHIPKQLVRNTFGRNALPITWDFCEIAPTGDGPGNYSGAVDWITEVIRVTANMPNIGQVQVADASASPLPEGACAVWFTDPPYYDAIPYSDLADFFFVWLKRTLSAHPTLRDPFDPANLLTPKQREIVQDDGKSVNGHKKDRSFFESAMARAFAQGRRVLADDGIGSVVFAHKTTEGWEALLSGMSNGRWVITASWPITTEMGSRIRAMESAALATSVHLVCRPRAEDAPVGDWGELLRELPNRVGSWMERLQAESIRGADLVFACIGPALEIYSKYSKVEDAEGREILLGGDPEAADPHERGFLAYVWETVGRVALEQVLGTAEAKARNGAAGAVEEDARLTALFLWTLQGTNGSGSTAADDAEEEVDEPDEGEEETTPSKKAKGFTLVYDVVRRFAQPLGIHLPDWEGRILETKKGVVRLLAVSERAKQLFGDAGASAIADRLEEQREVSPQMLLFPEMQQTAAPKIKARRKKADATVSDDDLHGHRGATTLDRVHAAMLLQASGRANALRALIKSEQQRGPDFVRLSNALSALYPPGSEEKRLIDAMLLAVPR